ncbi:hypothetical protein WA026_004221 [Henosepilachna vigintioctopunctata]|uniref:Uncharacterized protein n=1 Tax=Henosepilachna vigintioctopunctata TaxID=420089 RepID=A0AAW1U6T4_9CUCU
MYTTSYRPSSVKFIHFECRINHRYCLLSLVYLKLVFGSFNFGRRSAAEYRTGGPSLHDKCRSIIQTSIRDIVDGVSMVNGDEYVLSNMKKYEDWPNFKEIGMSTLKNCGKERNYKSSFSVDLSLGINIFQNFNHKEISEHSNITYVNPE